MLDYSEIQENIFQQLTLPYVYYAQETMGQKVILARHILNLDNDSLLIPACTMFSYPAIFAGLNENKIGYIIKNAPTDYKKIIAETITNEMKMKEVFEIAKMMDEDLGEGITQNQKRIKNVYQYILDNWAVFQF